MRTRLSGPDPTGIFNRRVARVRPNRKSLGLPPARNAPRARAKAAKPLRLPMAPRTPSPECRSHIPCPSFRRSHRSGVRRLRMRCNSCNKGPAVSGTFTGSQSASRAGTETPGMPSSFFRCAINHSKLAGPWPGGSITIDTTEIPFGPVNWRTEGAGGAGAVPVIFTPAPFTPTPGLRAATGMSCSSKSESCALRRSGMAAGFSSPAKLTAPGGTQWRPAFLPHRSTAELARPKAELPAIASRLLWRARKCVSGARKRFSQRTTVGTREPLQFIRHRAFQVGFNIQACE